jgi:hypothetical protein
MPILNISSSTTSDMTNNVTDYSVGAMNTDAAGNQEETSYINTKWSQYLGYYKQIPELKRAIDARALWTLGRGYKSGETINGVFLKDIDGEVVLEHIKGWGRDTFNTILKNMIITAQINGDAFCEVMRDNTNRVINIKPLDPGSIKIIVDRKGRIKRYEQINKIGKESKVVNTFKVEDIFHICRDRVADEIHGVSIIEAVENVILSRNEAMTDLKKVMHRFVKPMMKFTLDTDDVAKIDAFVAKYDKAVNLGENLYVPKDTVQHEIIAIPANATLNPLPYIENLSNFFYQAVGIPQIIVGGSQEFTEATAKIAYLSFQQSVEDWQLDIETQVWQQLQLKIELDFPASLQNELISDTKKDSGQMGFQPGDMTTSMQQE